MDVGRRIRRPFGGGVEGRGLCLCDPEHGGTGAKDLHAIESGAASGRDGRIVPCPVPVRAEEGDRGRRPGPLRKGWRPARTTQARAGGYAGGGTKS